MKKNALILALILFANLSIAKDLILVKFNTHNYDTTLSLIKALESRGVFTDTSFYSWVNSNSIYN